MAIIRGNNRKNTLNGTGKADSMFGLGGNDKLLGKSGNDTLEGGSGNDLLDGGRGNDKLFGGSGVDNLKGSSGNDRLDGGSGDDFLAGGTGKDVLFGGKGLDVFGFVQSDFKSTDPNVVLARLLTNGSGDDRLFGGAGNDLFFADPGADLIDGGAGDDFVFYTFSTAGILMNIGFGSGGFAAGDRLVSIEGIFGSGHDDILVSGSVNGTGVRFMDGGGGNDVLFGDAGANSLVGGSGNDFVEGRGGSDTLRGSDGNDVFVYRNVSDSRPGAGNRDDIADFSRAEGDRIDVSLIDANLFIGGDQSFGFIGTAGFGGIDSPMIRFDKFPGEGGGVTIVQFNVAGLGSIGVDFEISFRGQIDFQFTDFTL